MLAWCVREKGGGWGMGSGFVGFPMNDTLVEGRGCCLLP